MTINFDNFPQGFYNEKCYKIFIIFIITEKGYDEQRPNR